MADKLISELAKGTWDSGTAYTPGDIVDNDGSSYICIDNTTNNEPPNATYWALLAEKGDTGAQGPQGGDGPQGPQGDAGTDGISFIWLAAWDSGTEYDENDVVSHNGSTYIANTTSTNKTPGVDPEWDLMAQKGTDGEGAGDVVGPASSTNNAVALFDGVDGKLIKDSTKTLPGGTIVGTTDEQTLTNKQFTNIVLNGTVTGTGVKDEDDMTSNSATAIPTQQSVKAYVDTGTVTMTNKRITKRVTTIASNAAPTINTDNCDVVTITALATNITSMTTNLTGTPTDFQTLVIRIKDNGSARTIAWGASFEAKGTALPTTTIAGKVLTVGFIYDSVTSKWGCVAVQEEA